MDLAGASVLGSLANVTASRMDSAINTLKFKKSLDWSAQQAQLNRDFQLDLASNQYQRAVADMEAAGLNPAAIGSGFSSNAASAGNSAAMPNIPQSRTADFSNLFSDAVSMAIAKNKNVGNLIITEMKNASAREVQDLRNEGKIQVEDYRRNYDHASYKTPKDAYHSGYVQGKTEHFLGK